MTIEYDEDDLPQPPESHWEASALKLDAYNREKEALKRLDGAFVARARARGRKYHNEHREERNASYRERYHKNLEHSRALARARAKRYYDRKRKLRESSSVDTAAGELTGKRPVGSQVDFRVEPSPHA